MRKTRKAVLLFAIIGIVLGSFLPTKQTTSQAKAVPYEAAYFMPMVPIACPIQIEGIWTVGRKLICLGGMSFPCPQKLPCTKTISGPPVEL